MPRYVVLANWTDQGIRDVKHTTERMDHGGEIAEKHGLKLEQASTGPSVPTTCSPSSRHRTTKP